MVSERAAALADEFASANAEAVAFARACPADRWGRTVPGEGWTIGVVMHHIAESHQNSRRWVEEMARGHGVAESAAMIDEANSAHAVRAVAVTPAETVALLEDAGAALEAVLRGCSDQELDRMAPFGPADGRLFPTADVAAVPARHTREHLAHARAAAGEA
jgi:hypothetical protein